MDTSAHASPTGLTRALQLTALVVASGAVIALAWGLQEVALPFALVGSGLWVGLLALRRRGGSAPVVIMSLGFASVVLLSLCTGGLSSPVFPLFVPLVVLCAVVVDTPLASALGALGVLYGLSLLWLAPSWQLLDLGPGGHLFAVALALGVSLPIVGGVMEELQTSLRQAELERASLHEAHERLAESTVDARELDEILALVPDPIAVVGLGGEVLRANPAFHQVWGRAALPVVEVLRELPPDHGPLETACEGVPVRVAFAITRGGGFVLSIVDLTPQHEAAARLERARQAAESANLAKSSFLAGMSHELRTPLNAIIGYAEMLQEDAPEGSMSHEDLGRVLSSSQHLLGLINSVLDLSKIEAGKMELYAEPFRLDELMGDVLATVGPMVRGKGNELVVDLSAIVALDVRQDRGKLRQVLFNLLSNAAKFTEGGVITVKAKPLGSGRPMVRIDVEDTGIGMTSAQLDKLFDPYTQADGMVQVRFGGTGLGMALSRELIVLMGGSIRASSTLGEGTFFSVYMPIEAPEDVVATNS